MQILGVARCGIAAGSDLRVASDNSEVVGTKKTVLVGNWGLAPADVDMSVLDIVFNEDEIAEQFPSVSTNAASAAVEVAFEVTGPGLVALPFQVGFFYSLNAGVPCSMILHTFQKSFFISCYKDLYMIILSLSEYFIFTPPPRPSRNLV